MLAVVSSPVALGTSTTPITGLSFDISTAGTWAFEGSVYLVNSGSPTQTTFTFSPSSGPALVETTYLVARYSATAWSNTIMTGFNTATSATLAGCIGAILRGVFIASGPGTISLSGTRTGGTSQTVRIGSNMSASILVAGGVG